MPASWRGSAGKYVAGAYVVVFVLVLIYVAIMAVRLSRIERELGELLARETAGASDDHGQGPPPASATPAEAGVGRMSEPRP